MIWGGLMEAKTARRVMELNQLIPRRDSRRLLDAIANGEDLEQMGLNFSEMGLSPELLDWLRNEYREKARHLSGDVTPRNLPFYMMIKERTPEFEWYPFTTEQQVRNQRDCQSVRVKAPRVQGIVPSLASLLLGGAQSRPTAEGVIPRLFPELLQAESESQEMAEEIFSRLELTLPDTATMAALLKWLETGMKGQTLTIFFPVCPDYSYERSGSLHKPYRYTFEALGTGVGLVARRALNTAPVLAQILEKRGIRFRLLVGGGDFEGLNRLTCEQLNVSESEFRRRVGQSMVEFKRQCRVPVDTSFITDLCGGTTAWLERCQDTRTRLAQGDFGGAPISYFDVAEILKARQELYRSWLSRSRESNRNFFDVLLNQAAEYSTMGWISQKVLPTCLVFACDHAVLAPFYQIEARAMPLYLKPTY